MRQYTDYFKAFKQYISIRDIYDEAGKKPPITSSLTIDFLDVSFRYPSQEKYALRNVTVKISYLDKVSIVGENGAGKTTFIKLLLRIYKPTEGKITLNGIDINQIDYAYYISLFSSVFQDYKLFSFSLADNISLNDDTISLEEKKDKISNILNELGLYHKTADLEKGFGTFIYKDFDQNGFTPSGGEGQKIAIARAAYKKARIAILDEPTASLDPKSEYDIYMQFDSFFKDRTCIYISHRLAYSKKCTNILVFKNSEVIEQGSHNELIMLNGEYAKLYTLQAKFYD